MKYKKFMISLVTINILLLSSFSLLVFLIDPYMYFHRNPNFNYYFSSEDTWLYNPGIARNFKYDCVVAGSSMLQNTDIEETDELFNSTCIKLTESGSSAFDIKSNLSLAFSTQKLKYVFFTLDPFSFNFEVNESRLGTSFDFLYNRKVFDKFDYLLNKNVILDTIPEFLMKNYNNEPEVTMTEYQSWYKSVKFSKENVLKEFEKYRKRENQEDSITLEKERVIDNLEINVIPFIEEYSNTQFSIIISPRSILNWYVEDVTGNLENVFLFYDLAFDKLLHYDNVSIYFFANNREIIENLDYFKDLGHFKPEVNSNMMKSIQMNDNLITKENYKEVLEDFKDYIKKYDFQKYL